MAGHTGRPRSMVAHEQTQLVGSAHDAVVVMDPTGMITSCNPAAARLYDYPVAHLVGTSSDMLVPLEQRAAEADVLARILRGEEVPPYHADRVSRSGSVLAVFLTVSPILDADGAVVGATSTARRASLQDTRDRFEARVDKQRADAHDAADRFEVRVHQEREETRDAAVRFERRVAAERVQARDAEDRFQDGIDAERTQAQSDREHLESQLQQSQRLDVLGQLAGGVAHDFNNVLAVILNQATFVADELARGPHADLAAAARDVGQIHDAAHRAATLTHQLLAFARREVTRPQVLDLDEVVTNVERLLRQTLGEDITLRTEPTPGLWPVLADPGQLEQVLAHLAVNARDAMSGGGLLSIDTANTVLDAESIPAGSAVRPGRHVRLRVDDTGAGMPADVLEHAFEPFFTTKADGTGAGLGLATVHGIVAQADGSVSIQSRPGNGTTVTILIPATEQVAVPVPVATAHRRTPNGELILVVEDDGALRRVTERIFTRAGYQVITAANGPQAVALAAAHQGEIHLLVTDVVMPGMLGKQVAERIREIKPGIEVLYMSGYAQRVLAAQGRLDAGVHVIEKPFSAVSLIEMAGQALDDHVTG